MLNAVIRFALRQPLLIVALAVLITAVGMRESLQLPIDVFPDLNRPQVVILTEAHGYAPEEVERLINIPLESVLNGATNVADVRTSAGMGVSVIYVSFDWGTDIFVDRQIVKERLDVARGQLPPEVEPQMAPIASIMGQVMMVGMYIDADEAARRREAEPAAAALHLVRREESISSADMAATPVERSTSMLELRELADWTIRRRLMNIDGVAQVFVMGGEEGGARQVQVLVNPDQLRRVGVTLRQVETALGESNENATGGYVHDGARRRLVRSLGRLEKIEDLEMLVVDGARTPPVLLNQVARVVDGPEIPLGRASVNGRPAVMMVVVKQPGGDTRELTEKVLHAFDEIRPSLPPDVVLNTEVYRMDQFIERAVDNVVEALRDGGILVVIVLFIFLMNFRTTFITLTAIPLSVLVTILVFRWLDMSINTMTLGGLAVAIGELVDDAIVDIENIYRRLRENRLAADPRHPLIVIYKASVEVRNSIVFATMLVVLVFIPLFALGGMEGRLFTPLGVAYIVSILASLLVSLTVTPVLAYYLLPSAGFMEREKEGFVLRLLRWMTGHVVRWSLRLRHAVLIVVGLTAAAAVLVLVNLGRDFLPPFNEGSVQVSVALPPGTSLDASDTVMQQVERQLLKLDDVVSVGRRTGRAEEDEHVMGVEFSEMLLELDPDSHTPRKEQLAAIRGALDNVPGAESTSGRATTEQPISHLMSHMLSGVKAQFAVKLYGDDLSVLRQVAQDIRAAIDGTPGVVDLMVEPQTLIPQMQIVPDRRKLAQVGLRPADVNHIVETAMNGEVVSQVLEGDASFDLLVRLDDPFRESLEAVRDLSIPLPSGGAVPLDDVADIYPKRAGPNSISREKSRRRIVVQCNASGRSLSAVRSDIEARLVDIEKQLPQYGRGYFIEYAGQFEAEQAARLTILVLSIVSLVGIFLVLYSLFGSVNLALQVMAALPMAAIGAVAALLLSGQNLSVPAMVGFISLAGIASRNGILLISHYLHLVQHEGEEVTWEMVVRAGQERVAPVLMTALTSGIGLVPLIIAGGEPGKEILYPVATVIVGGLISSTLLDFFVHPALFWTFGRGEARRLSAQAAGEAGEGEWGE